MYHFRKVMLITEGTSCWLRAILFNNAYWSTSLGNRERMSGTELFEVVISLFTSSSRSRTENWTHGCKKKKNLRLPGHVRNHHLVCFPLPNVNWEACSDKLQPVTLQMNPRPSSVIGFLLISFMPLKPAKCYQIKGVTNWAASYPVTRRCLS